MVRKFLETVIARIMRQEPTSYVRVFSGFRQFSDVFVSGEALFAFATQALGGERDTYTFWIPAKAYLLLVGLAQADARTFGTLSWELGQLADDVSVGKFRNTQKRI